MNLAKTIRQTSCRVMLGLVLSSGSVWAAQAGAEAKSVPVYQPKFYPFDSGERVVYDTNWNGLISVARAEIVTTPQIIDGKKFYNVRVEAKSSRALDFVWKMRDTITSTIEAKTLAPSKFTFSQRENSKVIDTVAQYDAPTKKWTVRRDERKKVKNYDFDQPLNTLDPITAVYLARSQDIKVGDHLYFHIFGGKYRYLLDLEVEKRETIKIKSGNVDAFKILPRVKNLMKNGYAQRLNEAAIWISADERRVPVMLTSKIVFGTVYMELVDQKHGTQSTALEPQLPAS
ncbi:MAG: DUF3108 domain-containing protein [Deltaproteobacteria bacterium]|nr:DUF3108 domain-containing protein [Deltaproteobacteria bacterium]